MNVSSPGKRGRLPRKPHSGKVVYLPAPRRRRRAIRVGSVVVALGLIGVVAVRVDSLHTARIQAMRLESPHVAQEFALLKLVNDQRARAGVAPLHFSPRLMAAARAHSREMAEGHYLGPDSPGGDTPASRLRAAGVNYDEMAENVYEGSLSSASMLARQVVKGWMDSPPHRANLLSPDFRLTAAGVARADNGTYYVTEDFSR